MSGPKTLEIVSPAAIRRAVEWLAKNANGVSLIDWEPRSHTLLAAAGQIEDLRDLANHLRHCVECGEMDVSHCHEGLKLWNQVMPDKVVDADE